MEGCIGGLSQRLQPLAAWAFIQHAPPARPALLDLPCEAAAPSPPGPHVPQNPHCTVQTGMLTIHLARSDPAMLAVVRDTGLLDTIANRHAELAAR